VVEDITAVESVDIVCDPTTVAGLFESIQRGQAMTSAARATATRAIEGAMDGAGANLRGRLRRVLVEQLDGRDHRNAITAAFTQAGHGVWTAFVEGEITERDMLAKLRKLAKGHRDAGGSGDGSGTPAAESRGPRWDAGLGRLVWEDDAPDLTSGPLGWSLDRPPQGTLDTFVESITGRRPSAGPQWDSQVKRIKWLD
jgi:hypothetical protein